MLEENTVEIKCVQRGLPSPKIVRLAHNSGQEDVAAQTLPTNGAAAITRAWAVSRDYRDAVELRVGFCGLSTRVDRERSESNDRLR